MYCGLGSDLTKVGASSPKKVLDSSNKLFLSFLLLAVKDCKGDCKNINKNNDM